MRIAIPKRMTNDRTLKVLQGLRMAGKCVPPFISSRIIREHLEDNVKAFAVHRRKIMEDGGFIENQNEFTDMFYGRTTVRFSGCEIIAAYNVLHALTGREPSFPKMIAAFEKNGMIFYGTLGTDPGRMKLFFEKNGFYVEEYTDVSSCLSEEKDRKEQRNGSDEKQAYVLTLYNDRMNLLSGIHTVAVTRRGRWLYLHNDGGIRARGPFAELELVLNDYERRGARMISILKVYPLEQE